VKIMAGIITGFYAKLIGKPTAGAEFPTILNGVQRIRN
jgi:hypothetical protein